MTEPPTIETLCTCRARNGKLHRKQPDCTPHLHYVDADACPHGADDPHNCLSCRIRRYYDREE